MKQLAQNRHSSFANVPAFLRSRSSRRTILRRALGIGIGLPSMSALLAACGGSAETTSTAQTNSSQQASSPQSSTSPGASSSPVAASKTAASGSPKKGGTARLPVASSPTSWDLTTSDWPTWSVIHFIYDRLLQADENEKIEPMLATSWHVSNDGLTYTLHLREGVAFHDGTPFNADAVKINIERYVKAPDSAFYQDFEQVKAVNVLDEHTVEIHLKKVQVYMLFNLAGWGTIQVSPTVLKKLGDKNYGQQPTGTGPFKFKTYVPDSYVEFVRNDDYWQKPPLLDGVRINVIPQPNVQIDDLQSRSIDEMGVEAQDVATVKKLSGVDIKTSTPPGITFLSLNVTQAPTSELAVRKAIARALDRKQIIDKVLYGYAVLARAGASPGSPYYFKDVPEITYDPDEAGKILDAAGWKMGANGIRERNGKKLFLSILADNQGNDALLDQIVQEQLKQIGFDSKITQLEWGTYLDTWRTNKGGWNATIGSQGGLFRSTDVIEASWAPDNFWNICQIAKSKDPKLMQVSKQLVTIEGQIDATLELPKRQALAKQAQQLYQANQLTVWMWHGKDISAVQTYLKGYEMTWHGRIINLNGAWLDK